MANTRFQHKRSLVSGVTPTTSDIAAGELGLNLADRRIFTSNGSSVFELGSNLTNLSVTSNLTVNAVIANGSIGSNGQYLTSNGSGVYWSTISIANTAAIKQTFTANSTVNTTFTVTGGYTVGLIDVYKNGVKLINGTDVTVNNGSTVVLAAAALSGEVIDVSGYLLSGVVPLTLNGVETLTNKRIDPRVSNTTTTSSFTPDIGSYDIFAITALASNLTINATTGGIPATGNKLIFRIKDDGSSRGISWITSGNNSFREIGVTLPTTTVANKVTYVGCIYNAEEIVWDVIATSTQA